jgi:hypothetical protein
MSDLGRSVEQESQKETQEQNVHRCPLWGWTNSPHDSVCPLLRHASHVSLIALRKIFDAVLTYCAANISGKSAWALRDSAHGPR